MSFGRSIRFGCETKPVLQKHLQVIILQSNVMLLSQFVLHAVSAAAKLVNSASTQVPAAQSIRFCKPK
jgi:hypothetical protein